MISIVDYNMGNICSVTNALDYLSISYQVITTPAEVLAAERLLLPGVGGFSEGIRELESTGLGKAICEHVSTHDVPLLGICLGMQLLAEQGEEGGKTAGLGLIPGVVKKMMAVNGHKIPHVGWEGINKSQQSRLLSHITSDMDFYFVHSYHFDCPESYASATVDHGGKYVAAVENGNIFGVQFHPEKSQHQGLSIIKRFSEI